MKTTIRIIQMILVGVGIYGIYGLVMVEVDGGDVCPKVFGISACYIILGCLAAMLLSFLSRKMHAFFSLGGSIAWCLAATGSYYQYQGMSECPKMENGTPMCYVALGLFTLLFIFDFIHGKLKK